MLITPQNSGLDAAKRLRAGLLGTRQRLAAAAAACARDVSDIRLLAVTKGQPLESIQAAAQLGQIDFAESYVQEALQKMACLQGSPLVWHYIGQLQANKTRAVAENFDWVHTVDRERVARRLHEHRPHYAGALNICIQINIGAELGKGGIQSHELLPLARRIAGLSGVRLRGLMCIPPATGLYDAQLHHFQQLGHQLQTLREAGFEVDTLSMGMSADLEAAIAAGATMVRIGTAIFGERQ